jgi:hypothetical protein
LKLGIHHLWVDALCIVQDDDIDWQIESAKMAAIYQNAFLTLAATSSSDCSGGCYLEKDVAVVEHEIYAGQASNTSSPIWVRKKLNHWTVPPTQRSIQLHPLLSRGWAFQERILSPRVLHFCGEEMVWECKETIECECGGLSAPFIPKDQFDQMIEPEVDEELSNEPPDQVDGIIERPPNSLLKTQSNRNTSRRRRRVREVFQVSEMRQKLGAKSSRFFQRLSHSHKNNNMEIAIYYATSYGMTWHRLVEQYSFLQLTKATDRLPALSGLAQRASLFLGTYLAGLWSVNLLSDLMWRVDKLDFESMRSTQYTGPSWSWVAVTQPVEYWQDLENEILFEEHARESAIPTLVSRCRETHIYSHVKPAGKNPFGGVASGILEVTGYYRQARLKYVYSRSGKGKNGTQELVPDKYELEIPAEGFFPGMELSFYADYLLREPGKHHVPDNALIHLLLVNPYVCLVLVSKEEKIEHTLGGITIIPNPVFERIGIVRQPNALPETYGVNWISGADAHLRNIRIV